MNRPKYNICVYCGSGPGVNPAYMESARKLGACLGKAGIGLVYGGGSLGLMGEVARATLASGGYVTGIIPDFLVQREKMLHDVQDLIVTHNMHERKMAMFEHANGFVALPGGIGTLEELVEVSTWAQLQQHDKPVILANIENYWTPLLQLFHHMREEEFIRKGLELRLKVVTDADEIVPVFQREIVDKPDKPSAVLDKM